MKITSTIILISIFLVVSACSDSTNTPKIAQETTKAPTLSPFQKVLDKKPSDIKEIPNFMIQSKVMGKQFDIITVTYDQYKNQPKMFKGLAKKIKFKGSDFFPSIEIMLFDEDIENKTYNFEYVSLPAKLGLLERPQIIFSVKNGGLTERFRYTLKIKFSSWKGNIISGNIYFHSTIGKDFKESNNNLTIIAGKFDMLKK
jgi:hypothetical protein